VSGRRKAVMVTGMGVVTPYGPGLDRFWEGIVKGEGRIAEYDRVRLPSGLTLSASIPEEFLADVDRHYGGRKNAWAMEAILAETLGRAGPVLPGRGAVFFGNAYNGDAYANPDVWTREWEIDHWARWLQQRTGAQTASSITTACTTGNTAISLGADWVAHDHCDWALVGAMEMLDPELILTFEALRMTSKTGCRPFGGDHDGTVLGDGAGLLLLESAEHAAERKARALAEMAGFALVTDGGMGKLTSDGSVVREMMVQALASAGMAPSDLSIINAAATGGAAVDDLEAKAIDSLFGERRPTVYSIKPLIGQSIGGTGAVEAIATILSLIRQEVPVELTDPRGPRRVASGRIDTGFNSSIAMTGHMCATVFRRVTG
jgi:3-oxoacyl-(acyl-carrier-protein) synthase